MSAGERQAALVVGVSCPSCGSTMWATELAGAHYVTCISPGCGEAGRKFHAPTITIYPVKERQHGRDETGEQGPEPDDGQAAA